jgi:hypothetical protein
MLVSTPRRLRLALHSLPPQIQHTRQHSYNQLLPSGQTSHKANTSYLSSSPAVYDASPDASSYDPLWQLLFVVVPSQIPRPVDLANSFGHDCYNVLLRGLMPNCPIYPQNRSTKGHRRIRQNLGHLFRLCQSAVQYVSPFRGIKQVQLHEVKRKRHSKDRRDLQQELSFWVRVHLERAREPEAGLPTQVQRPR